MASRLMPVSDGTPRSIQHERPDVVALVRDCGMTQYQAFEQSRRDSGRARLCVKRLSYAARMLEVKKLLRKHE